MNRGLLDMSEQLRHVMDVMLALLQPALWLLLCLGFVLASAHLLTMLGTRWGDRRVSPKAMLFSIAVHLSLAVAVIAMIPEYRQHILSLGQDEPPAVAVELLPYDPMEPPPTSYGTQPAWDQIPLQPRVPTVRRDNVEQPAPAPPDPERPSAIQLADVRPVEPPTLPELPDVMPDPAPASAPTTVRVPAAAPVEIEPPPPAATPSEARPDSAPTEQPRARTQAALPPQPLVDQPGRPPEIASIDRRPSPRLSSEPLASLASPARIEMPELDRRNELPTLDRNLPAPQPLPEIRPLGTSSPAAATAASAGGGQLGQPRRSRSQPLAFATEEPLPRSRSGLPVGTRPAKRGLAGSPLFRHEDPLLPELHRLDVDPTRSFASTGPGRVPASYGLRTDQERKDDAIRRFGGNEETQRAVERALRWLAAAQEPDGRWNAARYGAGNGPRETSQDIADRQYAGRRADAGITGLALLALLGNGNSLSEGAYSLHVERAVRWIISIQKADGSLAGDAARFEAMYCHGIATLALAEAYAMETDAAARSSLRGPLEKALDFCVHMQLDDGGWRYLYRQEGGGDMSMFGWQLMAFRSAQDGGIAMPETTRAKMITFLTQRGRGQSGGLAGYREADAVTATMTAEALYCKQMLGLKRDNPMAVEAVAYLLQHRPRLADMNLYYWYYGTLAMFQHGGDDWEQWNAAVRDLLVSQQVAEGSLAGSWEPRDLYSRYGGRVFSTAVATLCLEVYYRRLPMYQWGDPPKSP